MILRRTLAAALALAAGSFMSAAQAETIKFGVVTAQTGAYAFSGVAIRNGIKLALSDVEAGKLLGDTQVEIVEADSGSDKGQAITLVSRMIQSDKVLLILGPTNSFEATGAAPVANEHKVPFIAMGSSNAILEAGPFTFKMLAAATDVMGNLTQYALDKLAVKKVSIVYDRADAGFVAQAETVKELFEQAGVEIVSVESIQSSDNDFLALATKFQSQDLDGFFVAATAEVAANVLRQVRQAGVGMETHFMGPPALGSASFIETAGSAAEGAIILADYFPGDPVEANQIFVKKYSDAYGHTPDGWGAMGYTMAMLAVEAVKKVGADATPETVSAALAQLREVPVLIGNHSYSFDEERNPHYGAVIITVKDGAFALAP